LLENLEKTYKSSDYSTTFTASRVAWVAKDKDKVNQGQGESRTILRN
jgi:hypothetical protein